MMTNEPMLILSLVGMLCAYLLGRVTRAPESPMGGSKQRWVVTKDRHLEVRLADADGVHRCTVWLDADEATIVARALIGDKP